MVNSAVCQSVETPALNASDKCRQILERWARILPKRIADEEIGDWLEVMNDGCADIRQRIVLKAILWTALSAIIYRVRRVGMTTILVGGVGFVILRFADGVMPTSGNSYDQNAVGFWAGFTFFFARNIIRPMLVGMFVGALAKEDGFIAGLLLIVIGNLWRMGYGGVSPRITIGTAAVLAGATLCQTMRFKWGWLSRLPNLP